MVDYTSQYSNDKQIYAKVQCTFKSTFPGSKGQRKCYCGRGQRLLWGGGPVTWPQPLNVHKQRAVVPRYYISTMYCSTFQSHTRIV